MFQNYEKAGNEEKVLMMYLLLNKASLENIKTLEEVYEERSFGLKIKKIYGLTTEHINVKKIKNEIRQMPVPVICSEESYEYFTDSPYVYVYTPQNKEQPLMINDLSVISNTMIVLPDYVVSDNPAKALIEGDIERGFEHFMKYVLDGEFKIGDWNITYKDSNFKIVCDNTVLYEADNIDKLATYKKTIYIIKKVSEDENASPDNFICEKYRRKAN